METKPLQNPEVSKGKITTIKLSEATKSRLDHLKLYQRETYEEIMQRFLEILNTCRQSPERARIKLIRLEKERKRNKMTIASQNNAIQSAQANKQADKILGK